MARQSIKGHNKPLTPYITYTTNTV